MTWKSVIHYRLNRARSTMTNKKQIDKFRDMARKLECDESEKTFDKKLKKIASRQAEKD